MSVDVSTAARLRLGTLLRSLRRAARLSGEQAAAAIRSSLTKVSRIESGRVAVRPGDVAVLLDLYGVSGAAERDELLSLAGESGQPGWWDRFPRLPARVRHDLSLEAAAALAGIYDAQAVPALLQTPAYARAVCELAPDNTWRAGLGVRELAHRRELLTTAGTPRMWVLIGAAVLTRHPAEDPRILRDQIGHLIAAAARPEVSIQVVPQTAPTMLVAACPFTMLRFAPRDLADIVLLEHLTTTATVEERLDVEQYWEVFYLITGNAYTPEDSIQALAEIRLSLG